MYVRTQKLDLVHLSKRHIYLIVMNNDLPAIPWKDSCIQVEKITNGYNIYLPTGALSKMTINRMARSKRFSLAKSSPIVGT